MGLQGIVESWRCFGKNPALATQVLINTAVLPSNPVRYVLELERHGYLEDAQTLAMGTAMLYSMAFAVFYAFISMSYGMLWI